MPRTAPSCVALSTRALPTLTTTLATGLLAAATLAGCASEPERPPPPRPASAFAEEPGPGPVASSGSRPRGAVGPAGTPRLAPASGAAPGPASPGPGPSLAPASDLHPEDELAPALGDAPAAASRGSAAGDEAGETDAQRIARLEREAGRGGGGGGAAPIRAPRAGGTQDESPGGRRRTGRGEDDDAAPAAPAIDKELVALLERANEAAGTREWATYTACFSPDSQRLIAASWSITSGIGGWALDQKSDKNSKGSAKLLWLVVGKCGVTRPAILDVVEARTTPRAAVEAHRQAQRDPARIIGEVGPYLPFARAQPFLSQARIEGGRGKGVGATASVRGPEGVTIVELQLGPTDGTYVLHVKDADAWLDRLDRTLTTRIAAKE